MSLDVTLTIKQYRPTEVFWHNCTHNLAMMAEKAWLYEALWRPDEKGFTKASQLIPLLTGGLAQLKGSPEHYKQFNPENGWGSYEGLVAFVEKYLEACKENPDADVEACR